jgi:hypothetical protein
VAKVAESLLCCGLGIVKDGEEVTELALQEFALRFEGQISDEVFLVLKEMFKVDSPDGAAVEEALIGHGGAAGLDLEAADVDQADV